MDRIKNFFESNIFEFLPILIGIYLILYMFKIDLHLLITIILFLIYFYYKYNNHNDEKNKISSNRKEEKFQNKLPSMINKYDDIINFLLYISDFKQYNEQVYNDLLINLNDFLTIYQDYQIVTGTKKKLYADVILDTKHKILEGLSSFIFSFNNSPILREKLNNSINKLNNILSNYLKKINIIEDNINAANNYL